MRDNRHFVRSTDVSALTPALIGGAPSVTSYHSLIERIEKLAGRDAAALFAEPVLPSGVAGVGTAISWYCAHDGTVVELETIDEIARRRIIQKLSARLAALEPALRDPTIGQAVATWLNIAAPAAIMAVGGEPVLVDWGFVPSAAANDPASRASHFAATLGRFAPALPVPPIEAALSATGPDERAPSIVETTSVMPAPPPPSPPPPPGPTTSPTPSTPVPPPARAVPPAAPPAAATTAAPAWRTPAIAAGIAALVLIILLLPGVLRYPDRDAVGRDAAELQRLRTSNDSLEMQLAALQDAGRDRVCKAGDPIISVPDKSKPDVPPAKMELVPRPPDQVAVPDQSTVAGLLDAATVLVYAVKLGDGESEGTGFFISDRDIVTNRHVIEHADPETIFVASRALGGIRHARLVVRSDDNPGDSDVGVDLAVLEVDAGSSSTFLPIGPTPPKLSTIYVAGFPGFITEADINFTTFLRKLADSLRRDNVDEALKQGNVSVPSPDLRYGRVNNIMKVSSQELPIILHDMQLAPGHSGGPVVDACGRVSGINTWVRANPKGPQQANLAQDVTIISQFLRDHGISFKSDESPCSSSPSIAQTLPQPTTPPK